MTKPLRNSSLFDDFSLWVNLHPELPSGEIGVTDIDKVFHRYVMHVDNLGTRELQCFLLLEVKCCGAAVPKSQQDTLYMLNQLLATKAWKFQRQAGRFMANHPQNNRMVKSKLHGRQVEVHCFGLHYLRMEGLDPERSQWLLWNEKPITKGQLVKILRFELHPHTLKPLSFRRHKRKPYLPLFE